ncbi:MAG: glycosyltransferase, partial [Bacteroidetes bacterium]
MTQPTALVAIYGHPENYPPTLNALTQLAELYERVFVLFRPTNPVEWPYPDNVQLEPSGPALSVLEQEQLPVHRKVQLFARFVRDLRRLARKTRPALVLVYDPMAAMAAYFARDTFRRALLWYHNHDVLEPHMFRRFSLTWWATFFEPRLFPHLDLFTLPAEERKAYFPMEKLKGRYFFLPNLPARSFYQPFYQPHKPTRELRILFQGAIGPGHGIEQLLEMIPFQIQGLRAKLVLKGALRPPFKEWLERTIELRSLEGFVEIHGYTAYQEVPRLAAGCHIGLAIHAKHDIMNKTLGTASNKIYEYAALGLPVLYFDNPHFRKHLGKYPWAIPTTLEPENLREALQFIVQRYEDLSAQAHRDFLQGLHYEGAFEPLKNWLTELRQTSTLPATV